MQFRLSLSNAVSGEFKVRAPLIKPSRLTDVSRGGVGKELSTGWVVNFAIGCTHACPFCYVDNIHKRFFTGKYPETKGEWGTYLLIPEPVSFKKALEETPWHKWRDELVLMSSTHDPFLPQLLPYAKVILETGLKHGVHFLIQTRSLNALQLLPILAEYKNQVIFQVSIATVNETLRRVIEPHVPPAEARLMMLKKAKEHGLRIGVIIAPIIPPNKLRPSLEQDLDTLMRKLASIGVNQVFGEMLHVRGFNIKRLEQLLGERIIINGEVDRWVGSLFEEFLKKHGLKGRYWYEYY
ncbi:MAG: radical SAM protein [Caldivirga sp.]